MSFPVVSTQTKVIINYITLNLAVKLCLPSKSFVQCSGRTQAIVISHFFTHANILLHVHKKIEGEKAW